MSHEKFVIINGKIYRENLSSVNVNNRSFRYGDGCFETLKVANGKIILEDFHFARLFASLEKLKFEVPFMMKQSYFVGEILDVCNKNHHLQHGRVRLTIYRGNGGLYDPENNFPNYLIQSWHLSKTNIALNENGLDICIYKEARKSNDGFSNIKSNNFLCYAMAAMYAKDKQCNDALLLNHFGNVADSTIANLFLIKNGQVFTPPLSDGCIDGTLRKYLMESMLKDGQNVVEKSMTERDIAEADGLFLTNAIYGIRWVKECEGKSYNISLAKELHQKYIKPLFAIVPFVEYQQ